MKRGKYFIQFIMFSFFMTYATSIFGASPEHASENAFYFGILTILPPVTAIALAFLTKNVILSLFFGIYIGCFMLKIREGGFFYSLTNGFLQITVEALESLAKIGNAGIVLQVLTIGALISLITRMGGIVAIAESVSKFAKSARTAQLSTWLMGIFIFFDDYANSLTVGPMMRPVTDKMRVSREKLSFIVDATAAPISGMALISTWVAYEIGLISDTIKGLGLNYNAYGLFVSSLPYRFYNIFILIFILVTIYFLREFGSMYIAEYRARSTGEVLKLGSDVPVVDKVAPFNAGNKEKSSNLINAIVPLGTLIIAALVGFYFNGYNSIMNSTDPILRSMVEEFGFQAIRAAFGEADASRVLFQAALISCIVAIILGLVRKIFTISEALDTCLAGIKSMNITVVVLLLAWSLSGVVKELGTAHFLVEHLSETLPYWLLPSIIFILGSIISFATGTSYGTMGILMPLAIPLAWNLNPNTDYLILSVGAVLTGAIFGDHCSPISDTTILSSMGAGCGLIDHVNTQILYSVVVGIISIFAYLLAALGVNLLLIFLICIVTMILLVRFVGKLLPKVEA